ncbi:MAG: hypothetical protein J5589_03635 [Firmicutes bacterium]|nr:hypothetical protein [Bacillota bacterium]
MKKRFLKAMSLLLIFALCLGVTACSGNSSAKSEAEPSKTEAETAETETAQTAESSAAEQAATEESAAEESVAEEPPAPTLEPGYYKLYSFGPDSTVDVEGLAAMGLYYFMVIEPEGKGFFHMLGEETELTWDDKNITLQTGPVTYQLEGDVLTILNNNQPSMIFNRSDEPAPARGEAMKNSLGLSRLDEIILKDELLADTEDYTIVLKEIIPPEKEYDEYVLVFTLTNKISDDNLGFEVHHFIVNGITVPVSLSNNSSTVKPGETKDTEFPISLSALKEAGTGDPTRIDIYMRVKPQYDPADKFLDYLTIYPLGQDKEQIGQRVPAESDQVLEDNDQIKLTYIGLQDKVDPYGACLFWLENKTDQPISATAFQFSLNGEETYNAYGTAEIGPRSSGILTGLINFEGMNGLSLDELKEVTFTLGVTNIAGNESITQGTYTFNLP